MPRRPNIDLDRRLLALLQGNARESTSALAKRLGVARSTVHERITRLERDGVITGYSAILARRETPDGVRALVMLCVRQRASRELVMHLRGYPEVTRCLSINGAYDLFLDLRVQSLTALDTLLDEIANLPGVERTESSVVLASKFDRDQQQPPASQQC